MTISSVDNISFYNERPRRLIDLGQAGVSEGRGVYAAGAAARADGSIVLAGYTNGDWAGEMVGQTDFASVALDEDGAELWRWQVWG